MTPGGEAVPSVVFHGRRYAAALTSANAYSNFIVRLQVCDDQAVLRTLAREFSLLPEICLPVWGRMAALTADDPAMLVEAATAFYRHGYDEPALDLLLQALQLDDRCLTALELKAALTQDPYARRLVFEEILRIDPGNRVAVDNLIILDRPQ